jgi:hypothetical protein
MATTLCSEFKRAAKALDRASFIEVDVKIGVIAAWGLVGEPHFAILNSQLNVYLLKTPRPAPYILAIADPLPPGRIALVDLIHQPAMSTLSTKHTLANKSAACVGVPVRNLYIVP